MTKRRVLFVDDDPNILAGIRRVLRSFRDDFELYFAENGKDALEIMAETAFDVVVSDMRMPGMDGADLLKKGAGTLSLHHQDHAHRTGRSELNPSHRWGGSSISRKSEQSGYSEIGLDPLQRPLSFAGQ